LNRKSTSSRRICTG